MKFIYFLKKSNLKAILISIFVSFHLFFWDVKFYENYGFRETIVFAYFFLIYDLFKDNFNLFKKNKKNLLIISLFVLIIFFHQFVNSYYDLTELKIYNIFAILGLYSLLILIYFYYSLILENIKLIILFFLSIFTISYLFSEIRTSTLWEIENLCSTNFQFLNKFIFLENSHLGMIFGAIVGYFLYEKKNSNYLFISFVFFFTLIIILFESSSTLYLSLLISMFLIFFFDFKFFFKKILICFFITMAAFILINAIISKQIGREAYSLWCLTKFSHTVSGVKVLAKDKFSGNIYSNNNQNITDVDFYKKRYKYNNQSSNKIWNLLDKIFPSKQFPKKIIEVDKKKAFFDLPVKSFNEVKLFDSTTNFKFNLSTSVMINSLNISYETLKSRPLGWGINRYENAFDYYMFNDLIIPYFYKEVYTLNSNDGSANISKLLTEFGWISLMLIPALFVFLNTNRMSKSLKIFFLCLILTQLARGAGYFYGGFIFSLIFVFFTIFNFYAKKNGK